MSPTTIKSDITRRRKRNRIQRYGSQSSKMLPAILLLLGSRGCSAGEEHRTVGTASDPLSSLFHRQSHLIQNSQQQQRQPSRLQHYWLQQQGIQVRPTTTRSAGMGRPSDLTTEQRSEQLRRRRRTRDDETQLSPPREFAIAVVPKSVNNPFFESSKFGCHDAAAAATADSGGKFHVHCVFVGPVTDDADGVEQEKIIAQLVRNRRIRYHDSALNKTIVSPRIDGVAISVRDMELVTPLVNEAIVEHHMPVVTFDSDAPDSLRHFYIGTDNYFFGEQIAKLVMRLQPDGGIYATVGVASPNIQLRLDGLRKTLKDTEIWDEVSESPYDYQENLTQAIAKMDEYATKYPGIVIAPVLGGPMRSGLWEDFVDRNRNRNLTLVSGDAMEIQLQLLDRKYVQGLVGQSPYEMGFVSVNVLLDILKNQKTIYEDEIIGTNVFQHVLVPLKLPELIVDQNLLGPLHLVGYILFGIVAAVTTGFVIWTFRNQNKVLVQVSQPFFLYVLAAGIIVLASTLIPLSFDDDGQIEEMTTTQGVAICMSIPWLASSGFTITFSALFSKTMRVNKIFQTGNRFQRQQVGKGAVLIPFLALFSLNMVVLIVWTTVDPLHYVRLNHPGTDGWNRILSTYGTCQSTHSAYYLIPLAVVNLSVLAIANWQAYNARLIENEFSEAKYIGLAMASLLQLSLVGIPLLFVVRGSPQAFYLLLSFMIFILCLSILLFIFVPKIVMSQNYDADQQWNIVRQSIRQSQDLSTDPLRAAQRAQRAQRAGGRRRRVIPQQNNGHDSSDGNFASQSLPHNIEADSGNITANMDEYVSEITQDCTRNGSSSMHLGPYAAYNSDSGGAVAASSEIRSKTSADRSSPETYKSQQYGCSLSRTGSTNAYDIPQNAAEAHRDVEESTSEVEITFEQTTD